MTITVYVEATPPRLCEVEGCGRAYRSKGLCGMHYSAARYAINPEKEKASSGAWYARNPGKSKISKAVWRVNNPQKVKDTSAAWYTEHRAESNAKSAAWRADHHEEITVYEKARYAADPDKVRAKTRARYAIDPEKVKATISAWRAANPEKHRAIVRANNTRRRAREVGNVFEPYDRADIFERDEWVCQLCNLPIDPELRYPDPGFGTIDHVTPLALGGSDEPTNVVAAHLVCNLRKGTHLEPLPDNVVDFVTEFDPDLPIITFA
jgi:5-methylcytosine-specific restriction endonuclease McrA